MLSQKVSEHYIDNEAFKVALKEYAEQRKVTIQNNLPEPQVSNYIAMCFLKIAKGVGTKHNFRNYSYLDDMIQDAVFTCLKNIKSFDPDRGTSPFSYFTQCVWYAFLGTIKAEKRKEQLKRDMFFRGDCETYSVSVADEGGEFQLSYVEFIKSHNTDTAAYETTEKKKKKKFDLKHTNISCLYEDSEDSEDLV